MDAAPRQVGQFTTFGEFTEAHLQSLFGEIEKDFANYPLLDGLAKRYYLLGIRNRLLHGEGAPNPRCAALNSHLRLLPDGRVRRPASEKQSASAIYRRTISRT